MLANGTLVIEDAHKSDSGLYLCRASNGVATDLSKVVRLTVHGTWWLLLQLILLPLIPLPFAAVVPRLHACIAARILILFVMQVRRSCCCVRCVSCFSRVCVCEAFGVWISFSHQLPPPPLLLLFFRFPSPATGFLRLMNPFLGSLPSVSAHFCSNDWISCGSFAVYVCLCRKTRVRRLLLPSDQECEE